MRLRRAFALVLLVALAGAAVPAAIHAKRLHRLNVPPKPALPRALSVDETEYVLSPSRLVVSAGKVTINAYNRGMDDHDLVVFDQAGTNLGATFLPPGEAGQIVVTLPAGNYRIVCSLFAGTPVSHETLGMVFTLTAQNPPAFQATSRQVRRPPSAHGRGARTTRRA